LETGLTNRIKNFRKILFLFAILIFIVNKKMRMHIIMPISNLRLTRPTLTCIRVGVISMFSFKKNLIVSKMNKWTNKPLCNPIAATTRQKCIAYNYIILGCDWLNCCLRYYLSQSTMLWAFIRISVIQNLYRTSTLIYYPR
jgi:hypothetical protein